MVIFDKYESGDSSTFGKSLSLRVDGGFNAVSINPSGRDVVLAGRRGLYIIDLDDPFSPPRLLHHSTPWQVADVQWSPHPAKPYWVVSTSNQKALIWNLMKNSNDAIEHVLHGHSRAITDINFNFQHPDILATCSVDTYVHAWDLRSASKPFYTTSAWRSGASQVKWNHHDANIMASSHGNELYVWDIRKGSEPLRKLEAIGSLNNIDFNRFNKSEIMSSGNDGTVNIWDYSKAVGDECKRTISTDFPIWRSRYLPFGNGFCVMPMVDGYNSIYMMNLSPNEEDTPQKSKLQPIYAFKGHSDRVIDFLWRSRYTEEYGREFQMVTWSVDGDLRLWPVADSVYEKLEYNRREKKENVYGSYEYKSYNNISVINDDQPKNNFIRRKETFVSTSGVQSTNNMSHLAWLSGIRMNQNSPNEDLFVARKLQNLGEEVSAVGHKFPRVIFEKILVSNREITITLNGPWSENDPEAYIFIRISIYFPIEYPSPGNPPKFVIEENPNLKTDIEKKLLNGLVNISETYANKSLFCLEPCIRYALGEEINLEEIDHDDEPLLNFDIADQIDLGEFSSVENSDMGSGFLDESSTDTDTDLYVDEIDPLAGPNDLMTKNKNFDSTPVPNECGAIWTSSGQLLCFFASEGKHEKKQQNLMKFMQRDIIRGRQNFNTNKKVNKSKLTTGKLSKQNTLDSSSLREVDTDKKENGNTDGDSDDSFDSFENDWDDILRNDIVVRNKFPVLQNTFPKAFSSMHSESAKTMESGKRHKNYIILKDFNDLIPDKRELALEYHVMDLPADELAKKNALVAEKYGFEEITHCWQILSDFLMVQDNDDPYSFIWDNNPMSIRWFLKQTIQYFEKQKNVQMLAMIYCVLCIKKTHIAKNVEVPRNPEEKGHAIGIISFEEVQNNSQSNGNTSRSVHSAVMTSHSYERGKNSKYHSPDTSSVSSGDYFGHRHTWDAHRAMSSKSPLSGKQTPFANTENAIASSTLPEITLELLDDDVLNAVEDPEYQFFDEFDEKKLKNYVLQYSSLLYQWNLPIERVNILKASTIDKKEENFFTNFTEGIGMQWVANENSATNTCVYCRLKAQRSVFICGNCQHIIHLSCAKEWWNVASECASGCGCNCPNMFDVS
ncbi:hypothetical protein RNJ44_04985 [Nakaseomyces bracarensis]|uniref:RWD domain-containing protein n=1 Tax=Nakaseomyces bracarensis TaxID=273131 RepID=A0ABR4NWG4_9SACH